MVTQDELKAALAELGDTPEAINEYLCKAGIKGYRGLPSVCPIARFIRSKFNPWLVIVATDCSIAHRHCEDYVRLRMPGPVRAFIMRFDGGDFPGLCE